MSETSLQELIDAANRLCETMEEASNNDRRFCAEIQIKLEQYSYDLYRSANDLKSLLDIYGETWAR